MIWAAAVVVGLVATASAIWHHDSVPAEPPCDGPCVSLTVRTSAGLWNDNTQLAGGLVLLVVCGVVLGVWVRRRRLRGR